MEAAVGAWNTLAEAGKGDSQGSVQGIQEHFQAEGNKACEDKQLVPYLGEEDILGAMDSRKGRMGKEEGQQPVEG